MAFGDIVLLKDRIPVGPFSRRQIQEGLTRGEFTARDLAHTPGLRDWLPLLEVLHHLDREVVHWPRTREGRDLPPVPGTGGPQAGTPSRPEMTPPIPPVISKAPLSPLPVQTAPSFVLGEPAAPARAMPPVLPLAENPAAAAPAPPPLTSLPVTAAAVPAPLGARFGAWLIDWAVLFVPVLVIFAVSYGIWLARGTIEHRDPETTREEQELLYRNLRDLMLLVAIGFAWIYAAGLECSRWQGTIGKQAMGLMVSDEHGNRISFARATGRHAAKYLSALPLFLGFMAALFNSQRRTWHDQLASTRVVKNPDNL